MARFDAKVRQMDSVVRRAAHRQLVPGDIPVADDLAPVSGQFDLPEPESHAPHYQ